MKHNGRKTQNQITTTKVNMQTEVFWTLLVCLLCTIVLELFLISLKIEDWIEVSKIRQDSMDKIQGIKARYVPYLRHYNPWFVFFNPLFEVNV